LLQVPGTGGEPTAPPSAQPAPETPSGNDETNGEVQQTPAHDSIPELQPMAEADAEVIAKVLTAEEVEQELKTETFSSFLNIASKKVERVLNSTFLADLLVDYDGESNGKKRIRASDGSTFLTSRQVYECSPWTQNREVTDMDWSPLHTELMLCSYHMSTTSQSLGQQKGSTAVKNISPDDSPSDSLAPRTGELMSDGLALVWNLAMPSRPEHIFTCGSPVTTTRFHPTESPLIIGGCQSGQVVVWDVRAGRMPVQKSSLVTTASGNSKGHTHPICSMQIVEGNVS
jgi:dynein intermediate chain